MHLSRYNLLATALVVLPAIVWGQQAETQNDDSRLEQVLAAVAAGSLEEATSLLEELVQSTTPQTEVLALLGALYAETGRSQEALETLRPLAESPSADPAVLYNAGRVARALGQTQEAEAYLKRSLAQAPGSPAARELGMIEAARGDYREAYRLLKPWATGASADEETRLIAALCAVQLKRPNEAEELLSTLPPDQPKVRLLRGKLQLDRFEQAAAIETLEPLMADPPAGMELDVRRTLSEAYLAIGKATEAADLLEGWVGENPGIALQLAKARYQSANLEGAITVLQPFAEAILAQLEATSDLPPAGLESRILSEYGRLLNTAGRHQEALGYLQMATRIAPGKKESWQHLGQALAVAGRTDEARQALEKFQQISGSEMPPSLRDRQREDDVEDPTSRELSKAMTQLADGDSEAALATVRQEREFSPEDVRLTLLESRILLLSEDYAGALEAAELALQLAPDSPDTHYQRGSVLMALGQEEAAEAELRQALAMSPDHTAAMNDLAVLLMRRGDNDEARQLLERVVELRPDDELAAENLRQLIQP